MDNKLIISNERENIIIPDTNIISKILKGKSKKEGAEKSEVDIPQAEELIHYLRENRVRMIAPQVLIDELLNFDEKKNKFYSKEAVLELIEDYSNFPLYNRIINNTRETVYFLTIVEHSPELLTLAKYLQKIGEHSGQGTPDDNDCIFHALAFQKNGIFLTNDKKHYRRFLMKEFGYCVLLEDWKKIFGLTNC